MDTTQTIASNSGWWLALAIVTAGLAEQKGRSRLAWFGLGLLLGPIATAMVVIWAPPAVDRRLAAPPQLPSRD